MHGQDDPHGAPADGTGLPGAAGMPVVAGPGRGTGLDLGEIAGLVLEATVPRFADAAAVLVLERLLETGETEAPGGRGTEAGAAPGGEVVARRLGTGFARGGRLVTDPAFPAGEVLAFAEGTPCARCATAGEPVVFGQPDSQTLERAWRRPDGRAALSRYHSCLTVPMTAADAIIGFLVFGRGAEAPAFSDRDAADVAGLAARAGTCVASACRFMRQASDAEVLQRGLLPADPPVPEGVEAAWRCLPAPGHIISGDWYDIIALPEGRAGLLVGDAMGHGPRAVAVMAQLRGAAHVLAELDLAPAEVLRRLDRAAMTLPGVTFATCVYTVLDPAGERCVVARAGHPPPVLALPDGTTQVPHLPAGLPLGLGAGIFTQVRLDLPPGTVLALYTDGLVESRTRSSSQGILALRSVLARQAAQPGPLPAACDALIGSLAGHREDDTTVILARIPPGSRPARPPYVRL
ncbi:MAG TPA: GAF domain-containing SpoIIE family protein phosphatase [Streptosporangiaceae bacterium]|nr:GAF domain-containing SpoIIE family protein phosphatase [Streptosporangiaceae bacterium]